MAYYFTLYTSVTNANFNNAVQSGLNTYSVLLWNFNGTVFSLYPEHAFNKQEDNTYYYEAYYTNGNVSQATNTGGRICCVRYSKSPSKTTNDIFMHDMLVSDFNNVFNGNIKNSRIYSWHGNDNVLNYYWYGFGEPTPTELSWFIIDGNLPYKNLFPEMKMIDDAPLIVWRIVDGELPFKLSFPIMKGVTDAPLSMWRIVDGELPFKIQFPKMYKYGEDERNVQPPSWFSFKGRSCTEFGCILEKLPLNIRNELATKIIDMPENTPFVQEPSGWKTRVITVTLGLKDTSNENIDAINSWLIGQGRLIFSDDPERHYIATCNGTLTGNRLLRLGKLPVQFIIMPHKRNNEESLTTYPITNGTVSIENKGTAPCEPVLVITGDGDITLTHTQSGTEITIKDVDGKCTVDVSRRKVYDALNNVILSQVSGNLTDLKLSPKTVNQIVTTGSVTKIEAILNERWL